MSIEDFLKSNPELSRSGDELGAAVNIMLPVIVQGISSTFIEFVHMGTHYKAQLKDILSLDETKDSSLGPKSAMLALDRDAVLVVQRAISAGELANAIPFGFAKLSPTSDEGDLLTAREKEWMRSTGYDYRAVEAQGSSGTFATGTKCPRVIDDERADSFAS